MDAYIVDICRTPVGKKNGSLAEVHPADLAAHILNALVERTGVDPGAVEDVILGCVDNVGPNMGDIARTSWLAAGLPEHVPGVTLDRQCGSAQQAVHFAAQAVMSGTMDMVVAGGVQNMSMIPIGTSRRLAEEAGLPRTFHDSKGWVARYGDQPVTQFHAAELIAEKWSISREDMEAFALESHRRALAATAEGKFDERDRPLRRPRRGRGARGRRPWRRWPGSRCCPNCERLTAAVSSQISDAATAALVVNERALETHGLTPRARVHHISVRADDPIYMLTGPDPGHLPRPGEDGPVHPRHRPGGDQRGVRVRRPGVAEGDRRRPRAGQRERGRHRPRSPDRRDRHPPHGDPAQRDGAPRRPATACRRCARAAARPTSRSSSASEAQGQHRARSARLQQLAQRLADARR